MSEPANGLVEIKCLPSALILDLDSTVETVYGEQAGAAIGTNPHKPGRKSYHPILVFEGQSRLCLNAVLRAGNTYSTTDAASFLNQTFELIGERPVKYVHTISFYESHPSESSI